MSADHAYYMQWRDKAFCVWPKAFFLPIINTPSPNFLHPRLLNRFGNPTRYTRKQTENPEKIILFLSRVKRLIRTRGRRERNEGTSLCISGIFYWYSWSGIRFYFSPFAMVFLFFNQKLNLGFGFLGCRMMPYMGFDYSFCFL